MDQESLRKQLHTQNISTAALDLTLIAVRGLDAQEFLQGQLTLDLREIKTDTHRITSWCNAKGRVWCVLRIWPVQDEAGNLGFNLLLPNDQSEAFIKRMRMFVLRAKVTLEAIDATVHGEVYSQASDAPEGKVESRENGSIWLHHDVHHALSVRIGQQDGSDAAPSSSEFEALRLLAGEPHITAQTQEQFLPQSLGIGELGGLHFNKGCYVGQEIVARVHYKGRAPQHIITLIDPQPEQLEKVVLLADISVLEHRLVQCVEHVKN